ncbi:MAG: DUF4145 domain-containing protein [Sedimentisphaerales bacterium]
MSLPENLKSKYLLRFDELIAEGEKIHRDIKTTSKTYPNVFNSYRNNKEVTTHHIDWPRFVEWRTKVSTLLCNVVPNTNVQYKAANTFQELESRKDHLEYGISFLKAVKEDFKIGMLESLASQWEAANLAEYMTQAEQLLGEGFPEFDHIPAAVLAGAVLEKALRGLCQKCNPPVPIIDDKKKPRRLNTLIDELKKADVYNESVAKQLRAWADIRNHAAHGEFDKFKRNDVDVMLKAINSFLANYVK